jgi:alkyl hydroperoxide reductase subunit AhpC
MNTKMTVQLSEVSPDSVKSRAGWKKWSKEKASQVRFWVEAVKRGEEVVFQAGELVPALL